MSDLFDDESGDEGGRGRPAAPTAPSRRSRAVLLTGVILAALFIALTAFSGFWTEKLWFDAVPFDSAAKGFGGVFTTVVWTRVLLFVGFGALMALVVGLNMALAYRLRPIFRPQSPEQLGLDRYREVVVPVRRWVVLGAALLVGAFAGGSAAGSWRTYLLWRNAESFNQPDPYFGRDLGFYVFTLPWLHFLIDFLMAVVVVSLIAAAVVHYLFGGIQLQNRRDKLSPGAQAQLSVLVGLFVLLKAGDYWLGRYDLLVDNGGLITGMTYTDDHAVLPARNILTGIALICAVLFFLNVWRRTWTLPGLGLGLLVLSSVLIGMIWPGIVQQFQVDPTEADKEAPYIEKNIQATRDAYNLSGTVVESYSALSELPTSTEERQQLAQEALNNPGIRLVDPQLLQQTFEQQQQLRGFYTVAPVLDVDRYDIEGIDRDLVLGVRELYQDGLPDNAKNWANLHTVYTHGYGVIAAFGNQRGVDNRRQVTTNEPAWAERDLPPVGELSDQTPDGYEGRVYFGEQSPAYSIVGKPPGSDSSGIEFDLPEGPDGDSQQSTTTYDGKSGVPVSGIVNKLLYAIKFGDPNIILSERVHGGSRILYDRSPREMVEKVAPWLTVDEDPYPAVVDGRVLWLLDGYTTTHNYPLSQRGSFSDMTADSLATGTAFQTLPTDEINYMRNAVKATVDAYDGTVTLYAWDETDPILAAWRAAFPGTVLDKDQIPADVLTHMRYPEDMFKVQRYQLASYHVTDPQDFYEKNDQWRVPVDPNSPAQLQPPFRLTVSTPSGGDVPVFSLTSVYTPANRQNLAAFVSVDAAADTQDYGTLRVLRLSSAQQVPGPGQIANQFGANQEIQDELLAFTRTASKAVYGNLLTLPIGEGSKGLLYVQPLYALRQEGEGNYPVLKNVLVSLGDQSGIGTTFEEAINNVLNLESTPTTPEQPPQTPPQTGGGGGQEQPTGTLAEQIRTKLQAADRQFTLAKQALADGDLAAYARHTERAQKLVAEALTLSQQQASRTSGG